MTVAVHDFSDVAIFARGTLLEIVLIITGAVLLARLVTYLTDRITGQIDEHETETDALVRSEASKHRHAVAQVLRWVTIVIIYIVAAVQVGGRLGFNFTGFVVPATVAGVALGFGAQRIVQDVLAGFFIVTERQYGYGDMIRIAVIGTPEPAVGTVEDVTLRVTTIRSLNGEVIVTPNGQIVQVTNLSRGWARAVVDVPVPGHVSVDRATALLKETCADLYADPALKPLLLDRPSVMGVESIDVEAFHIRVVARTLPGKQFDVGRALRARIAGAFVDEGVETPVTPTVQAAAPAATGLPDRAGEPA